MTRLRVWPLVPVATIVDTEERAEAAAWLGARGIALHHEPAPAQPSPSSDPLRVWSDAVERLRGVHGYVTVDLMRARPTDPDVRELRERFAVEHVHEDDEVRLFTQGGGLFYLRWSDALAELRCGRGDLLAVPAGQRHWFDAGEAPDFEAIRFFRQTDGWVPLPTGDAIAARVMATGAP